MSDHNLHSSNKKLLCFVFIVTWNDLNNLSFLLDNTLDPVLKLCRGLRRGEADSVSPVLFKKFGIHVTGYSTGNVHLYIFSVFLDDLVLCCNKGWAGFSFFSRWPCCCARTPCTSSQAATPDWLPSNEWEGWACSHSTDLVWAQRKSCLCMLGEK